MAVGKVTKLRRFKLITQAAEASMQVAIDFILIHNEERVKGRQTRSSLNRAMVLTAAGTWERFVSDTKSAFTVPRKWVTPGRPESSVRGAYHARAAGDLDSAGACPSFLGSWTARAGAGWAGLTITPQETLSGTQPGARSGLTLGQHLDQWVELRNGLAHQQVKQLANVSRNAARWKKDRFHKGRQDPYVTNINTRRVLWDSGAATDTLQGGAARSSVSLFVQVLDSVIVDIATHNRWDPDQFRLPAIWFESRLPERYRGVALEDMHHQTLWGGLKPIRR